MAPAIVAPATDAAWLSERHIVVGARVGSCVKAHAPFGTVVAIRSTAEIVVNWDDATTETVAWTVISPLGYIVEVAPVAASASQWAAAAMHLDRIGEWRTVRIAGERFIVLTSGRSGSVYHARFDLTECSCPWNQRTGKMCSHLLAIEMADLADELAAPTPAPTFPPCRVCGTLTDGPRRLCDDCAAEQARRLDIAQERSAVAA